MGELWIVATPIGNLGDMTPRAVEALKTADLIAAEDTRVTGALLSALDIHTRLFSCHKFNERSASEKILALLEEGKNVALVTDAGTPCVSDPGDTVAAAAAKAGYRVRSFPGASAVITALSLSGLCPGAFTFHAFPPRGKKELREFFDEIKYSGIPTHVLYDSPHRIAETMEILQEVLGNIPVCLCNDLTKFYERIYRGSVGAVLAELAENPSAHKGEYALVLSVPRLERPQETSASSPEAALVEYMLEGMSLREARAALQQAHPNLKKREIYQAALRLQDLFTEDEDDE